MFLVEEFAMVMEIWLFIANDWQTALLPVYLKAYYHDHGRMQYTRSVLAIHNIAHHGRSAVADFTIADLPDHYLESFRLYDPVGGEHAKVFAGGLKAADQVVTVSHGYAWELKTPKGGWGLHNIINENDWKLRGIVNGIDTKEWIPQYDVHQQSDGYTNYSLETLGSGKAQCKEALQRELGLPVRACYFLHLISPALCPARQSLFLYIRDSSPSFVE